MTQPNPSINKGGIDQTESTPSSPRSAKELIETEWKIIDKLQTLAETTRYDKQKAFYYQTLASHIRTLSTLLKLHGQPDQTADLAKLLSEITTQAKHLIRRIKTNANRTQTTQRKPTTLR
jgi:5-bromo-4-chloroindolyl phosphate hydrolysis protein